MVFCVVVIVLKVPRVFEINWINDAFVTRADSVILACCLSTNGCCQMRNCVCSFSDGSVEAAFVAGLNGHELGIHLLTLNFQFFRVIDSGKIAVASVPSCHFLFCWMDLPLLGPVADKKVPN